LSSNFSNSSYPLNSRTKHSAPLPAGKVLLTSESQANPPFYVHDNPSLFQVYSLSLPRTEIALNAKRSKMDSSPMLPHPHHDSWKEIGSQYKRLLVHSIVHHLHRVWCGICGIWILLLSCLGFSRQFALPISDKVAHGFGFYGLVVLCFQHWQAQGQRGILRSPHCGDFKVWIPFLRKSVQLDCHQCHSWKFRIVWAVGCTGFLAIFSEFAQGWWTVWLSGF
jgi:hypothetical protein